MKQEVLMNGANRYRADDKLFFQETLVAFLKTFGCGRKVYNLYTDFLYDELDKIGFTDGCIPDDITYPEVTVFKEKYTYLKEVDSLALANAKISFEKAVKNYNEKHDHVSYTKRALRRDKSGTEKLSFRGLKGMPKFRAKAKGDFSYTTNCQYPSKSNNLKNPTIRIENGCIILPKIKQPIPLIMHRPLPEGAVIKNATVTMEPDGSFYVSVGYEYTCVMDIDIRDAAAKNDEEFLAGLKKLGLDYSQCDFYVDSEGRKANYPHYYKKSEEKLSRLQRELSRMVEGSKNYERTKKKIKKLHAKVKHQREDFCHKLSAGLAQNYDVVIVEDLDLRALGSCLKLGKNLHDNGFGMFRQFLSYKLERKGSFLIKIDKWFASTKRCSDCGYVNPDVKLGVKEWVCPVCGAVHDRDENAAENIEGEGTRILAQYIREKMAEEEKSRARSRALRTARKNKKPSKKKKPQAKQKSPKKQGNPLPEAI